MKAAELVARARFQVNRATVYGLGRGVTIGESPRDETGACDCSAFACWCLGIRKRQTDFAWLTRLNGGWYNTDGIWWDAAKESTGFFQRIDSPRAGALVVFPGNATSKATGPKIGHVGIVVSVSASGAYRVVHCSNGNFKRAGDAIRETTADVFKPASTIFAWGAMVT
ncbi:MAG TPA: CHAP domain-containing protein [Vicinamibacterales bacterium]|nr:CHAP domain-containing protein [Vicinamibacterales bacterium]